MWQQLIEHWPWVAKIGGLITTLYLWLTAYPLLLLERRKNRALMDANKQMEDQNRQLEEIINQARRLVFSTDLSTNSTTPSTSITTRMFKLSDTPSNDAPNSKTNSSS